MKNEMSVFFGKFFKIKIKNFKFDWRNCPRNIPTTNVLCCAYFLHDTYTIMTHEWNGRFASEQYGTCFGVPTVKGKMSVTLPAAIESTNNIVGKLVYDGFYRQGHRSPMTISYSGEIGKQLGMVGGFKGQSASTNQTIDFEIYIMTDKIIDGIYFSKNPEDNGTFYMNRTTSSSYTQSKK